jgi:hypothetical protein
MTGSGGNSGLDVLRVIREDLERRAEAKENLTLALTSYFDELPRDPAGLPSSIVMLAEIWSRYAITLFDSLAERHFCEPQIETETLFGESGELYGGTTIMDVKDTLTKLKVRPGRGWPAPKFSQDGDSLDMQRTMRELARTVADSPYSFSWLLLDEWFMVQIRDRVRARADYLKQKFEQRVAPSCDLIQTPHATSGKPPTTSSTAIRKRRREVLKQYRMTEEIGSQEGLARHFGVSITALHGMVRGDRTRYSEEKLANVLQQIGISPHEW